MMSHYFAVVDGCSALAEKFPEFDMAREFANPDFVRLVGPVCRVDPETAYKALHFDEILAARTEEYARQSALHYANSIRSGAMRPRENGTGDGVAAAPTPNYRSKEYREDVKRRMREGERVTV